MTAASDKPLDRIARQAAARVDFLTRRERRLYARALKEALLWGRSRR